MIKHLYKANEYSIHFIHDNVSLSALASEATAPFLAIRCKMNIRNLKKAQQLMDEHFRLVAYIKCVKQELAGVPGFSFRDNEETWQLMLQNFNNRQS